MHDLFEQLAEWEVPPPPVEFDRQLHQRLNRTLVAMQVLDLIVRALPWALWHFGRALVGAVVFSLRGKYLQPPDKNRPPM